MKILTAQQIKTVDLYTIEHEGVSSIDLMERAALSCVNWIADRYQKTTQFQIFCGTGNNGGDGLAIARILGSRGYKIACYAVHFSENVSEDFKHNERRVGEGNVRLQHLNSEDDFPVFPDKNVVIIDAIFGVGLSRPVEGFTGRLIQLINGSNLPVISIDVPSGLFSEDNSENGNNIILADYTLSFEVPKLSFLFPENGMRVGTWDVLPIGLSKKGIRDQHSPYYLINKDWVAEGLRKRYKFAHKGSYGHALIVAGSIGKMGAAVLAASACLKAGAGLVTAHVPKCGLTILQTAIPEAMVDLNDGEKSIKGNPSVEAYNTIGIGPGIGTDKGAQQVLKNIIQNVKGPLVIDADGINILAENKTWLHFLPPGTIFTPHVGEFERLVGKTTSNFERLRVQREFAQKYQCYLILKGAHSSIACPDGEVYFNSTGNPGMATAGSGDVLTGVITGLLAQGYPQRQACVMGVYLHGLSGDLAAEHMGEMSLTARDIIYYIGDAVKATR